MISTLSIFGLTYLGVALGHIGTLKINRTGIALLGAILMVTLGGLSPRQALVSVSFPTIMMLYGLMILSGQLWLSGFYTWVAEKISEQLARPRRFLFLLILFSGLLSALLINDVICLAFAPVITLSVLKKKMNPAPFLIALAMAANIGAAATPIGNPQNILIANEANLHFGSYLIWCLPPVLLSLLGTFFLTAWLGKRDLQCVSPAPVPEAEFPPMDSNETWKGLVVLAVVFTLFFTQLPRALVMVTGAGLLLVSRKFRSSDLLAKVDWSILTLFASLFIVVGGLEATHLPPKALAFLTGHGLNLQNPYWLAGVSALLSNLMSNAATVMLLAQILDLSNPLLAYVLCLSNSFAGNLLLIGSIANLIAVEQGARFGVRVGFRQFARYGVPVFLLSFGILMLWVWIQPGR